MKAGFLKGKAIYLRPILPDDFNGEYLDWINAQESDIYSEHAIFPHTLENLKRYAQDRSNDPNTIWLAIVKIDDDTHIGNIEMSDINWVNRHINFTGILIGKRHHGKGYATEALNLLCGHVFDKLNLHRIYMVGIHEENNASLRMCEKCGFREEGRLRQSILKNETYKDVVVMGLLSSEFKKKV